MRGLSSSLSLAVTIIILFIGLVIYLCVLDSKEKNKEMNGCKDIGGHYIVVDKRWSAATKSIVRVYGCVKE